MTMIADHEEQAKDGRQERIDEGSGRDRILERDRPGRRVTRLEASLKANDSSPA